MSLARAHITINVFEADGNHHQYDVFVNDNNLYLNVQKQVSLTIKA